MYRITIVKEKPGEHNSWDDTWETFAEFEGDRNDALKFLKKQHARIHKEPYMAPRFEGEEPLPGLEA